MTGASRIFLNVGAGNSENLRHLLTLRLTINVLVRSVAFYYSFSVVAGVRGRHLTNRWSARVRDKVPSSYSSARGAQLNR